MNEETKGKIIQYLEGHNILNLATCKEGKPHASTLTYANEGLMLYLATFGESTKIKNIRANPDVALTVGEDYYPEAQKIKGIQYEGEARVLEDQKEVEHALELLGSKFPYLKEMGLLDLKSGAKTTVVKITPKWIRFIDYEKGHETLEVP